MPEKPLEQTDFFPQLEKPADVVKEKPEIMMESESPLVKKTLRVKSRPHRIKDQLPGVRLGSRDRKYHWE